MATGNWSIRTAYRATKTSPASAGSVVESFDRTIAGSFTNGTGDGQIEDAFSYEPPSGFTGTHAIILTGLSAGIGSLSFTEIREFTIQNQDATHSITFGGGTHPVAFLPSAITLPPGGVWKMVCTTDGYAVVAGTSDQINLDAGANTVHVLVTVGGLT